jgi:mono/diheme cytochrome c family protein
MKNLIVILIIIGAAVLIACSDGKTVKKPESDSSSADTSVSNGGKIYNTSVDENGNEITNTGGPYSGMMMMGGHLACASCHGSDGKGGEHYMMMQEMNAPDIRWKVLTGEMKGEGQTEEDYKLQKEEHKGYDFEMFKKGVVDGKHPDGEDTKPGMPRWNISDEDLRAVMNYLKSLDKG